MTRNTENAKIFGLPYFSTPEELAEDFEHMLTYGNKIVVASYFYKGKNNHGYYGAAYEFVTEDRSREGEVTLCAVSDIEFMDEGHAIAWAINA